MSPSALLDHFGAPALKDLQPCDDLEASLKETANEVSPRACTSHIKDKMCTQMHVKLQREGLCGMLCFAQPW